MWLVLKMRQGVSVLSGNEGLPWLSLGAAGAVATKGMWGTVIPSCYGKYRSEGRAGGKCQGTFHLYLSNDKWMLNTGPVFAENSASPSASQRAEPHSYHSPFMNLHTQSTWFFAGHLGSKIVEALLLRQEIPVCWGGVER